MRTHALNKTMSLAALLAAMAGLALAQEDPFAAGAAKAAARGGAPAAGARPEAAAAAQREPLVIELLRAGNPTTPEQLIAAAQGALQYGRPDESKRYLAKLLADKPADEALALLTARYSDLLFQLTRTKELQPEGRAVADLIFAAAQRITQDAERVAAAIAQLSDPRPGARQDALAKLAAAGTQVVNPMLHALADAGREAEHANMRGALVQLGGTTELPLVAALDTTNQQLKTQIVAILGRMGATHAALHLIRPSLDPSAAAELRQLAAAALQRISGAAPNLQEAEKTLHREIDRLMHGDVPYERDPDDRVRLWSWDEAKQQVAAATVPRRDAGALLAARLASDLYALQPGDATAQRLMLLTNLEWSKIVSGLDRPLPIGAGTTAAMAIQAGPQMISQVLADALRQGRVPAAIAAAEVLAGIGDASVLHSQTGASPLAEALLFSDRRVRLAAALAIVKLAPGESFAGAGRVGDTLGWFVNTTGTDFVLIGHPRGEEAQSLVGFMNALGYDAESAYVGRALAERAFVNPDHQFILVADAIDLPPVEELVQWLRRDFRTARQPVGVMARGERLDALRDALADDRFTTVFPRIHSVEVATQEIEKLRAIAGRSLVGREERLAQGRAALASLAVLAKSPQTLVQYELLRQEPSAIAALSNPSLAADAAALLALFGTPKSQSALVDLASQNSRPLADRQAAAAAFAAAVKSRGLLLTQEKIAQQYARYNASQALDQPTQELLGSILNAIEAPAVARGQLGPRQ